MPKDVQFSIKAVDQASGVFAKVKGALSGMSGAVSNAAASCKGLASAAREAQTGSDGMFAAVFKGNVAAQAFTKSLGLLQQGFGSLIGKVQEYSKLQGEVLTATQTISSLTGQNFDQAGVFLRDINAQLAVNASSLAGATSDYKVIARSVADNVVPAFQKAGKTDLKGLNKGIVELSTNYGALGAAANTPIPLLSMGLSRALGGGSLAELKQLQFFQDSPQITGEIERRLKANPKAVNEAGAPSFAGLDPLERFNILLGSGAKFMTPEFKKRSQKNIEAQISTFISELFDPDIGIFGLARDLVPGLETVESAGQAINDLITTVIGSDGLFAQIGNVLGQLGFAVDPMAMLRNSVLWFNDQLLKLTSFFRSLAGTLQRVGGGMPNLRQEAYERFFARIREFFADLGGQFRRALDRIDWVKLGVDLGRTLLVALRAGFEAIGGFIAGVVTGTLPKEQERWADSGTGKQPTGQFADIRGGGAIGMGDIRGGGGNLAMAAAVPRSPLNNVLGLGLGTVAGLGALGSAKDIATSKPVKTQVGKGMLAASGVADAASRGAGYVKRGGGMVAGGVKGVGQGIKTGIAATAGALANPPTEKLGAFLTQVKQAPGAMARFAASLPKNVWTGFTAGLQAAAGALRIFRIASIAAFVSNPMTIGITAIAVGALLIYKNWGRITSFFSGLFAGLKEGLAPLAPMFQGIGNALAPVFGPIINGLRQMWKWLSNLLAPANAADQASHNLGKTIGLTLANWIKTCVGWIADLGAKLGWVVDRAKEAGAGIQTALTGRAPEPVVDTTGVQTNQGPATTDPGGAPPTRRNAAKGSLGLIQAARMERRLAPASASLVVANSSETILKPDQMRRLMVGAAHVGAARASGQTVVNFNPTFNIAGAANAEMLAQQTLNLLNAKLNRHLSSQLT